MPAGYWPVPEGWQEKVVQRKWRLWGSWNTAAKYGPLFSSGTIQEPYWRIGWSGILQGSTGISEWREYTWQWGTVDYGAEEKRWKQRSLHRFPIVRKEAWNPIKTQPRIRIWIRSVNSPLRALLFIKKHRLMGKVKRNSRKNSEVLFLTGRSRLEK